MQRTAWRLRKSQQSMPRGSITHVVVQRPAPTQHVWRNAQDRGLAWVHGPVRDGNSALSRKMGGSWRGHCGCTGVAFIPRQRRQEGSTHQPAPEEASTGRVKRSLPEQNKPAPAWPCSLKKKQGRKWLLSLLKNPIKTKL